MDKERPAASHSAHAHLSGNGHRSEKSQEPSKRLKRKEYHTYVRLSWSLCVCIMHVQVRMNVSIFHCESFGLESRRTAIFVM